MTPLYAIEIAPCINQHELDQATEALRNHGFSVRQILDSGPVKIVRLLEGGYPPDEARKKKKLCRYYRSSQMN